MGKAGWGPKTARERTEAATAPRMSTPIPAAAPVAMSIRVRCMERRRRRLSHAPMLAPICTLGSSGPTEAPAEMEITEARAFQGVAQ